jgi:hypothetical protein
LLKTDLRLSIGHAANADNVVLEIQMDRCSSKLQSPTELSAPTYPLIVHIRQFGAVHNPNIMTNLSKAMAVRGFVSPSVGIIDVGRYSTWMLPNSTCSQT